MTLEEAGEIILKGESWYDCVKCRGKGMVRKTDMALGDRVHLNEQGLAYVTKDCDACLGSGGSISESYARACRVLGREIPQHLLERALPWDQKIMKRIEASIGIPVGYVTRIPAEGQVQVKQDPSAFRHPGGAEVIYRTK